MLAIEDERNYALHEFHSTSDQIEASRPRVTD